MVYRAKLVGPRRSRQQNVIKKVLSIISHPYCVLRDLRGSSFAPVDARDGLESSPAGRLDGVGLIGAEGAARRGLEGCMATSRGSAGRPANRALMVSLCCSATVEAAVDALGDETHSKPLGCR